MRGSCWDGVYKDGYMRCLAREWGEIEGGIEEMGIEGVGWGGIDR